MVGRSEGVNVQHWFSSSVILLSKSNSEEASPDGFIPFCMSLMT